MSSSSSRLFFFNRPPPASSQSLFESILHARRNDKADLISKQYPAFIESVQNSDGPLPNSISHARFQSIMRFVALNAHQGNGQYRLLLKMFDDIPLLGYTQDQTDHFNLVTGMVKAGKLSKAIDWLQTMQQTYGLRPTINEYNAVLQGYRRARDLKGARRVFDLIQADAQVDPSVVTYNMLIGAYFESNQLDGARQAKDEMVRAGLEPDLWTETAFLNGFINAREMDSARKVADNLFKLVDDRKDQLQGDIAPLNALIKYEAAAVNFQAALRLARRLAERGFELNRATLNSLVKAGADGLTDHASAIALINELENITSAEADVRSWTLVTKALLAKSRTDDAIQLYWDARGYGVLPDPQMVQPLLNALNDTNFEEAKNIYRDMAAASRAHAHAPDRSIYVTLLKGAAKNRDLPFSHSVINDMIERGVRLDSASLSWHISSLMNAATNWKEAFSIYDNARAMDVDAFDANAYNHFLSTFLYLPAEQSSETPAPDAYVKEFLSDMRKTGNFPNSATYTTLLSYYARLPDSCARETPLTAQSVALVHSLIKLDLNLAAPDVALFNALMLAYSRTGAANSAMRVWDSLVANRRADNASLSIALDTCGWDPSLQPIFATVNRERNMSREIEQGSSSGSISIMTRRTDDSGAQVDSGLIEHVWKEGTQIVGIEPNVKNWQAFVEALCRRGDFGRAEQVAFEALGYLRLEGSSSGQALVQDQVSVVEVLVKFVASRDTDSHGNLVSRIQSAYPDVYDGIKDILPSKNEPEKHQQ